MCQRTFSRVFYNVIWPFHPIRERIELNFKLTSWSSLRNIASIWSNVLECINGRLGLINHNKMCVVNAPDDIRAIKVVLIMEYSSWANKLKSESLSCHSFVVFSTLARWFSLFLSIHHSLAITFVPSPSSTPCLVSNDSFVALFFFSHSLYLTHLLVNQLPSATIVTARAFLWRKKKTLENKSMPS